MARHRNVRQFGIDDISIYDESLASSVDDDYGISPNTADRYLYSADKRNMNSTIFFEREDQEPLKISEEEFPVRDDCNEEYSPGYITGRIKSDYVQKSSPLKGSHGAHDLDPQDLILGAMDDQVKPDIERKDHDTASFSREQRAIQRTNDLEELDFESFEFVAMGSSNAVLNRQQSRQLAHSKPVHRAAVFSREYVEKLREVSDRVDCSNFSTSTYSPLNQSVFEVSRQISMNAIPGSKRPSSLGSAILPRSKLLRESLDYTISRLYQSLSRSRGITVLSIICPRIQTLKSFAFDIAEPVTFEKCRTSTNHKLKLLLPAPRIKRKIEGSIHLIIDSSALRLGVQKFDNGQNAAHFIALKPSFLI